MKTQKNIVITCLIMVILLGSVFSFTSVFAQKKTDPVQYNEVLKAFTLRMDGKADQAKKILREILAKDSTNAMAYYELSRAQYYMLTGLSDVKMEDIVTSADFAATFAPRNDTYAYYRSIVYFFNAFMGMQRGSQNVRSSVDKTIQAFEKVLEINPAYPEALLYLSDIYAALPKEIGGDSLKAIGYIERLEKLNKYLAAKARTTFLPDDADLEKYWDKFFASDRNNPSYYIESGRACLYKDDPAKAEEYFRKAIKVDASNNILILDLARYHIYKVMGKKDLAKEELPKAKTAVTDYLNSHPEPVIPLKAYATSMLSLIEKFLGNQEESEKREKEAKGIDPYFSHATGIPSLMLFDPPDKPCHRYFSFFRPF